MAQIRGTCAYANKLIKPYIGQALDCRTIFVFGLEEFVESPSHSGKFAHGFIGDWAAAQKVH